MSDDLTLKKKQQMEAIRLLNDWSKWVVTIETAAIAGIFTWLTKAVSPKLPRKPVIAGDALLILAAVCFTASIFFATQLLFSLPDIVEQLPEAKEKSINDMKGNFMGAGILPYEKCQWYMFVIGLALVIAAALAMAGASVHAF